MEHPNIKCHIPSSTQEPLNDESPILPWLVEHARCILSRCQKGRGWKTLLARLHDKKPSHACVPFGQKVLAKQISTDPLSTTNPRYRLGIWLGMRNHSEGFTGIGQLQTADGERHVRNPSGSDPNPADRWMGQSPARHFHEKTHTNMLVVTIRRCEERGICSAAWKTAKIKSKNEAWLSL